LHWIALVVASVKAEAQLSAGTRRFWIAAAAVAVFAAAWLVCEIPFRQGAGLSIALATALDAIAIPILAPYIPGPSDRTPLTPDSLAGALTHLRANVRSEATAQAKALTDRGVLAVPWSAQPSASARSAPLGSSVQALASFVESGGQLIALGGPQSGKTTLATRLVEFLAANPRQQPVLFTVSTWDPSRVGLKPWMLDVLRSTYGLAEAQETKAAALAINDKMIIPVFDGLDEIDPAYRDAAARSIRSVVGEAPAVLTSVPTPHVAREIRLALPAARIISLRPISAPEVSRYLLEEADTDDSWKALADWVTTHPSSPVGQALSSPLIAWLAKAVYASDAPVELTRTDTGAVDELTDSARFPDVATIERHLLARLPAAVFTRREPANREKNSVASSFRPDRAQRWLTFLASRARHRIIAFWEIKHYAPLYGISVALAIIGGIEISLAGVAVPYFSGGSYLLMLAGCFFGFGWARGYSDGRDRVDDPSRVGYNFAGQKDGGPGLHVHRLLKATSAICLAYAVGLAFRVVVHRTNGWLFGFSGRQVTVGLLFAVPIGFAVAYTGARLAAWILLSRPGLDSSMGARTGDPIGVIRADRRSGMAVFAVALVVLTGGDCLYSLLFLPLFALWAVSLAPVSAAIAVCMWDEWASFKAAHIWLAVRGHLPRRLAPFLQECHRGGILRKNGNHFEFRHRRLQDSLAAENTAEIGHELE
jgi:hypothetical protein